jgi:putative SOS response-associated peptidase YedK
MAAYLAAMCNLIRLHAAASGYFPDYSAPIVRNRPEERELVMARLGVPSPKPVIERRKSDLGVTYIRNDSSPHWRRWLGVESRRVVPRFIN